MSCNDARARMNAFIKSGGESWNNQSGKYTGYTLTEVRGNTGNTGELDPTPIIDSITPVAGKKGYTLYTTGVDQLPQGDPAKRQLLWRQVFSDKVLPKALEWGVFKKSLVNLCDEYGLYNVREAVGKVAARNDGYFRSHEPVANQRGKLLRKILKDDYTRRKPA